MISPLDHGSIPKKTCPQHLLQTDNECDKFNSHQNYSYTYSFRIIKVIQHCKNVQMLMAYIFLM